MVLIAEFHCNLIWHPTGHSGKIKLATNSTDGGQLPDILRPGPEKNIFSPEDRKCFSQPGKTHAICNLLTQFWTYSLWIFIYKMKLQSPNCKRDYSLLWIISLQFNKGPLVRKKKKNTRAKGSKFFPLRIVPKLQPRQIY